MSTNPPRGFRPAWAQKLHEAIENKVTSEVFERMIDAQIAKAEKGDERAFKFLVELGNATSTQPVQQVPSVQNNYQVNLCGADFEDKRVAMKIQTLLEAMGPLTKGQIAANLGLTEDTINDVLTEPRFMRARCAGNRSGWAVRKPA